jgi:hypothetical protein
VDRIYGGAGDDLLTDGLGEGLYDGQTGNDYISARQGRSDVVRCGPGKDTAEVDTGDSVKKDCEKVDRATIGRKRQPSTNGQRARRAAAGLPKARWWQVIDKPDYWVGVALRRCSRAAAAGNFRLGQVRVRVHPYDKDDDAAVVQKSTKIKWRLQFWSPSFARWLTQGNSKVEENGSLWTKLGPVYWTHEYTGSFLHQETKYRAQMNIEWYHNARIYRRVASTDWTTVAYCDSYPYPGSDGDPFSPG